jgi:hypothetical protein
VVTNVDTWVETKVVKKVDIAVVMTVVPFHLLAYKQTMDRSSKASCIGMGLTWGCRNLRGGHGIAGSICLHQSRHNRICDRIGADNCEGRVRDGGERHGLCLVRTRSNRGTRRGTRGLVVLSLDQIRKVLIGYVERQRILLSVVASASPSCRTSDGESIACAGRINARALR